MQTAQRQHERTRRKPRGGGRRGDRHRTVGIAPITRAFREIRDHIAPRVGRAARARQPPGLAADQFNYIAPGSASAQATQRTAGGTNPTPTPCGTGVPNHLDRRPNIWRADGLMGRPEEAKCVVLRDYTAVGPEFRAKLRHRSTGGRRIALLVIDALACDNAPRVHASLEMSLALARELRPVATRFVGMSHGLEHVAVNAELRALLDSEGLDCQLAHDGLEMHVEF